jgi:RNase P/RNase MRP subunit p29
MATKPLGSVQHSVSEKAGVLKDVPKDVSEYTLEVPEGLTVEVDGEVFVGPYTLVRTGDPRKSKVKKVDGDGVVVGTYHKDA